MDIQPASIDQVQAGYDGRVHIVHRDTGSVAQQLREIDHGLTLRYHEQTDHYSVVHTDESGDEQLVTTCQPVAGGVDPRVVEQVRKAASPGYDAVAEITAINDAVIADRKREALDALDARAEEGHFALRKLTGDGSKIFVPRGFDRA